MAGGASPQAGPAGRLAMLVSAAGRRVSLLRCFRESAEALGLSLAVHACDLKPEWSPACVEADRAHAAPPAESAEFIPAMLDLCEREAIGLLVPTIDTELIAYSHARARFEAIGTHVAVSDPAIVTMARDKLATAHFLDNAGIPTPRTALARTLQADGGAWPWPLLAKPRHGSSSRGLARVHDLASVTELETREPYVLQEIKHGREFTIGLFFDRHGTLRCAIPHERVQVRAGEVEKGVTARHAGLEDIARRLGEAIAGQARGALCFQAIVDAQGAASVFEINARFGGGYPLAHRAGARFTRWLLEDCIDAPRTAGNEWQAGVVMLRYDDAVFV